MRQSLFLPQLDSFDMMPSRSRKADTRGASIIPQNSFFAYNNFDRIMSLRACFSKRSNLLAHEEIASQTALAMTELRGETL